MNKRKRILPSLSSPSPSPSSPLVSTPLPSQQNRQFQIPKELWACIASFFCQRTRRSFRQVNKSISDILKHPLSMPQSIAIQMDTISQFMPLLQSIQYQQPQHLILGCRERPTTLQYPPLMNWIAQKMKRLKTLRLPSFEITGQHLDTLQLILKPLEGLYIPHCTMDDKMAHLLAKHARRLLTLEIGDLTCTRLSFRKLASSLKHLQVLKMEHVSQPIRGMDIQELSKHLVGFFIEDGHGFVEKQDYLAWQSFPELRYLHLGKEKVTLMMEPDALSGLDQTHLSELGLTCVRSFQEASLLHLLSTLPLQNLYLSHVCLSGHFLSGLKQNASLRSLSLINSWCTNDEHQLGTKYLFHLRQCSQLTSLYLGRQFNLNASDLEVLTQLPALKILFLTGCKLTSDHTKWLKTLNLNQLHLSETKLKDADLLNLPLGLESLYLDGLEQEFTTKGLCQYFSKIDPRLRILTLPLKTEKKVLHVFYKRKIQLETLSLGFKTAYVPLSLQQKSPCSYREIRNIAQKISSLNSFCVDGIEYIVQEQLV